MLLSRALMVKVSERLGHSSISITMDTYSHVMPNMQKEAARKLDDFLFGSKITENTLVD
ncbi:hypothetical protein ACFO25_20395 [Paenactinomyces guangxiensis]|uniref:hypothetical protein n=2 Tax=Paenactinomyces guangxiensis TaxID=1490290 RepID=UPI001E2B6564|nr:hypothetical protein [Paenactinomyces guangxiensis]